MPCGTFASFLVGERAEQRKTKDAVQITGIVFLCLVLSLYRSDHKNGNYLQVYDNATSKSEDGTSLENKLYYNSNTGKISGCILNDNSRGSQRPYTVS